MHIFLQMKNDNLIYVVHIRCSIVKKGTVITTVPLRNMDFPVLPIGCISGGLFCASKAFKDLGSG